MRSARQIEGYGDVENRFHRNANRRLNDSNNNVMYENPKTSFIHIALDLHVRRQNVV